LFDLSLTKLLVLAVIALVVFGPHELPKIASQAGRALRDLRRIADGAKADLREGLGPEFQDFDFEDLHPRRFVQKHLLDEVPDSPEPLLADYNGAPTATPAPQGAPDAAAAVGGRTILLDGEDPPFDLEAT
jgi:sec-independent protein translocase protein TatB